ncbi:MAG: chemotaxis protein CheW [Gemmatimonadaceae bacterium]
MSGHAELPRIVTFRVGRDLFAAPLERVERVLRYETPRRVPGTPDWVEGVIDYAGRAVPLVDLRRRFGVDQTSAAAQSRVLVLSAGTEWMAVVVDAVLDVRPLADGALEEPPTFFRGGAADAMRGMTRRGDDLVVVIDVDRLFAPAHRGEAVHRDG